METCEKILSDFLEKGEAKGVEITSIGIYLSEADVLTLMKRAASLKLGGGKPDEQSANSLHTPNVNRRVSGFVAMNKGEYDIENMSFYKTKKKAEREWGKKQDIVKVQVNFQHGG